MNSKSAEVEEKTSFDSLKLKDNLKSVFGYSQFRGIQEEIIASVMSGKNTFVIMPTGAGKSLCYQLPAVMMPGTAIVISPLIALMKNQVDQLNALEINAQVFNSTLSKTEAQRVKKNVIEGITKLLYVAPESLTKDTTVAFLQKANISFIAVDEAHCISEWGHDFRPEYRKIKSIIENIGNFPVIALTATATPKVQTDILKNLHIEDANVFKTSFNRPNLYYEVRPKINVKKELIKYLKSAKVKGKSGIIYCLSRKKVEEVCELLKVNDVKALPYHAGLDPQVRVRNQDAFLNEEADVIVATIAFGMGIDKPDVRFVIHYDAPKSLEGYYQETGRAGRDGIESDCIMFYSPNDILKLEKFNKDKSVTEKENARHLLQEIMDYATCGLCRRRQLLHYFGEYLDKEGGFNDNCTTPTEKFQIKEHALWVIKAILQTGERFPIEHIVDVLRGVENSYVKSYEHYKSEVYGIGKEIEKVDKEQEEAYWRSVIRQIMIFGYLEKDIDNFGVLRVSIKGHHYLENPYPLTLSRDHDFSKVTGEEEEKEIGNAPGTKAYDEMLFDLLKSERKRIAKEKGFPPYAIFQDFSLEEMATTYPTTREELAQINGVGMGKVDKFGKSFIALIAKYVEENEIETAAEVVVKSAVNKSKLKIFIIQQIDRKVDLDEIAESKNISMSDVIEEIEHICYSGTKLNLDYYINQIIEEDRQNDIYDYFMQAETDSIQVAMKELNDDDYTEEELRLMRVKFLSEIAN
ncbi:MAG TPA: DNA helicase RecQ [Microscillaceae bacterium]|nr:DNA helicase RecQ [Microscillaceae bacterium]